MIDNKTTIVVLIICLFFVILSCEKSVDPTMLSNKYRGITYTDSEGNIVGPVDESDWQLYINNEKIHIGFPDALKIWPVYPNPTDGGFSLKMYIPASAAWSISIMDEQDYVVASYSGTHMATIFTFTWNFKDNLGNQLPYGMYRIFYKM